MFSNAMSLFRRLKDLHGKSNSSSDLSSPASTPFTEKYIISDTVLGTGSYATVFKARRRGTNEIVAVKVIDKTALSPRELKGLDKEVNILKSLRHKNVVRFYDSFEQQDLLYVVMEYVSGGDLFSKIVNDEQGYSEQNVRNIIRTLGEALKHCKDRGVIHRDIKPQNLLMGDDGELKLADFNLSIQIEPDAVNFSILMTMCGTPNYVAPEILSQKPYDFKCDIWSLGVICYLLLSGGYLPFFVEEEGEEGKDLLLQKVRRGRWSFYPEEAWTRVSDEAKDFLLHVMERQPEKRFDYETLLSHAWLAKGGENQILMDEPINVGSFQMNELRRKMNCVGKMYQAVDLFKNLMEEEDDKKEDLVRVGDDSLMVLLE